jgi:hypothetical protein
MAGKSELVVWIYVSYSELCRKMMWACVGYTLCSSLRGTIECPTCAPPLGVTSACCFFFNHPIKCNITDSDDLVRISYICEATGRHCHGKSHYPKAPSPLVSTPLLASRWLTLITLM